MNRQESQEFAQKYIEDIVSFFGINVPVKATIHDDVLEVTVPASEISSILIGRNAETLRGMQYMLSTILRNKNAEVSWVNLDIADYKKLRNEKLAEQAKVWIEQVRQNGESYTANLNPADRRIVHQAAQEYSDIMTYSEGEGRDRRIVIAIKT